MSSSAPSGPHGSVTFADLIPAWLRAGRKVALTLCGLWSSDDHEAATAGELWLAVALWLGIDAGSADVHEGADFEDWESMAEWSRELECDGIRDSEASLGGYYFETLDLAKRALKDGELSSAGPLSSPLEKTIVTAWDFLRWANEINLQRLYRRHDLRKSRYDHSLVGVATHVSDTYYRDKSEGGSFDIKDPATHPHPSVVKATIRKLVDTEREVEIVYRVTRDRRIPTGRRPNKVQNLK